VRIASAFDLLRRYSDERLSKPTPRLFEISSMQFHYKAFLIVLVVTMVSFQIAKPVFLRFMSAENFARRRNVWLTLTTAAFLIPNFWLFMLFAFALLAYATAKDTSPAALYIFLLLVLPPITHVISIPGVVNELLTINPLRLIALVVLLPSAMRLLGRRQVPGETSQAAISGSRWALPDTLLAAYLALQLLLAYPVQSLTASARLTFDLVAFTAVPYFVISRTLDTRDRLVEAMASFALAMAVLIPLGVVEFGAKWLLYAGLEGRWEGGRMYTYLMRGPFLRAQVGAGHSLVFGFALAVAFGFWLYLQTRIESRGWRWFGLVTFVTGLVVSLARGPWLGAVTVLMMFTVVGPNSARRVAKVVAVVGLICGAVLVSPFGENVVSYLPFVGAEGDGSIAYRQQVAQASWQIIQMNPLFGSFGYMQYMESLRQGEGIIDIVNTYAGVALAYGLVGAALFLGFYLLIGWRCYAASRRVAAFDADLSLIGASLLACLSGALLMIATVSPYLSIPSVQMAVAGMASAYAVLAMRRVAPQYDVSGAEVETQPHRIPSFGRRQGY
jgi:hypothetical protein